MLAIRLSISGIFLALLLCASSTLAVELPTAPEGAQVYIISPSNDAVVTSPVKVQFGLRAMGVAPAGVNLTGTGHHHLLINVDKLPDLNQPLPATQHIKHFGKGQTEVELELPPGQHTLQLLMGNYLHIPHDKPVLSEKITITVQ